MSDNDTRPTIYEALAAVQAGVRAVGKGSRNLEQGYNFRGIDAVVNAVSPLLREHKVLVIPEVLESSYRDVTTSRGKPSRECTVKVRYRFYGPRGDFVDAVTPGESMDFCDKGTPKAMSVAFRVALLQALCLPTDEPDADSQSYERANREDDWERAEQPPNDTQIAKAQEFAGLVNAAKSEQDITNVGELVKDARGHERITKTQYHKLANLAAAKLAVIRGAS
jgi:hypothetical protein